MFDILKSKFQYLFEEELIKEIASIGTLKVIEKNQTIIDIGDNLQYMPLVIDGAIKVLSENEEGNELLLYYLEMGDACAMTMNCCLRGQKSSIRAISEKDTQLILLPIQKMEEWIIKYKSWRAYVFESYDIRLKEMLDTIDSLAFHNMEERLYKYLKDKALVNKDGHIQTTHFDIAKDLNSSRVVISRLIKNLKDKGKIRHHRNYIEIIELLPND